MNQQQTIALLHEYLEPLPKGKIRYSFRGPTWKGRRTRFVFPGNGISSHDFVLGFEMERKGEILNTITVHSKLLAEGDGILTDLIAWGPTIDRFLPAGLRRRRELWKTTTLVAEYDIVQFECIERLNLTGSAAKQYAKPENKGIVYGQQLPAGLSKNDRLPIPLWTPTTKAPLGQHDKPLTRDEVLAREPGLDVATRRVGDVLDDTIEMIGLARYADRKLEFGRGPEGYVLCDEVGTPDSSRIWKTGSTDPNDKDYIRIEAERLGIENFKPEIPADVEAVKHLPFTPDFIDSAIALYLSTPMLVTGHSLDALQQARGLV